MHSGRVSLSAIRGLQVPLASAASAVSSLVDTLQQKRSRWLIPTIWDGISSSLEKAKELETTTTSGNAAAQLAPQLLGASGARRYLVLLVNNVEVRPSGGIVSGIGLVTVTHGRFRLGAFHYYTDLAQKPYQRVSAPADFERRYHRFNADTTRRVNVTLSPDSEEVATVAGRLYQATVGKAIDGAIIIDPRGVAALLPPSTQVRVPGTHTDLTPEGLPRDVYSNAYRQLGGTPPPATTRSSPLARPPSEISSLQVSVEGRYSLAPAERWQADTFASSRSVQPRRRSSGGPA